MPSYLTVDVESGLAQSKPITYSFANVTPVVASAVLGTQSKFPVCEPVAHPVAACD